MFFVARMRKGKLCLLYASTYEVCCLLCMMCLGSLHSSTCRDGTRSAPTRAPTRDALSAVTHSFIVEAQLTLDWRMAIEPFRTKPAKTRRIAGETGGPAIPSMRRRCRCKKVPHGPVGTREIAAACVRGEACVSSAAWTRGEIAEDMDGGCMDDMET